MSKRLFLQAWCPHKTTLRPGQRISVVTAVHIEYSRMAMTDACHSGRSVGRSVDLSESVSAYKSVLGPPHRHTGIATLRIICN